MTVSCHTEERALLSLLVIKSNLFFVFNFSQSLKYIKVQYQLLVKYGFALEQKNYCVTGEVQSCLEWHYVTMTMNYSWATPIHRAGFTLGKWQIGLLGTRTSREKKMTNTSLWSIKVENGQVFIYLGKEKQKMHQVYRRVLSVKKSLYKGKDSLLVRTNLFIWLINSFFYLRSIRRSGLTLALYVMFLQFKFEPCPNGTHAIWKLNIATHMLVMAS